MLKVLLQTTAALGVILAGGCGSSDPNVGRYELDLDLIRAEILIGSEGKEPNSLQKVSLSRLEGLKRTLDLNADGTCLMTHVDGQNVTEDQGKWRVEGNKLFLDGKDRASQKPSTTELTFVDGVATLIAGAGPAQVFRKVAKK
jgi:hypothetical protein